MASNISDDDTTRYIILAPSLFSEFTTKTEKSGSRIPDAWPTILSFSLTQRFIQQKLKKN